MAKNEARRGKSLAKAALAKSNTTRVLTSGYEDDLAKFNSLSNHLGVSYSGNTVLNSDIDTDVNLNNIHRNTSGNPHNTGISDITGLQAELDSKLESGDNISELTNDSGYITGTTGYTGNITVVTAVDFVGESITTQTITVVDGLITGIS